MTNRIRVGKSNLALLQGHEDVRDWDEEELRRGRRRDRNGGWAGRPPAVVPKLIYDEITRRKMSKADDLMRDNYYDAVDLLGTVVRDPNADNKDRITAAKIIIERVRGREPLRVDVDVKAKWEVALEAAIVSVANLPIDAFATEDDDDPFQS